MASGELEATHVSPYTEADPLARLRLHRIRVRRSTSLLSLKSGSHMGVHMPPAGVVPPRVAHGKIG